MVPSIDVPLRKLWVFGLIVILVLFSNPAIVTLVHSKTDKDDVSALNVMYTSLNKPSKLEHWKADGGDPCDDNWKGIQCSGSSITKIDLSGMGLTGSLGYQLANLKSVTYFDLSNNKLKNDIPYQLPPHVDHLDLSQNGFTGNVPYSISEMKTLKYLNLGHNQLNGQLGDMFQKLSKLKELDLSSNKLSGDLPQSLKSLTSLSKLHLQNNQFTGSINMLRELPLNDLNVKNNKFTGWIPNELKDVKKLETGGNSWSSGRAPPPPPGKKFTSHANTAGKYDDDSKGLSGGAIAGIVIAVLVVLLILISLFSRRSKKHSSRFLDEERFGQQKPFASLSSKESSIDSGSNTPKDSGVTGLNSSDLSSSINMKGLQSSPSIRFNSPPSARVRSVEDDEFVKQKSIKRSSSIRITCYPLSDLQTATANFATGRLLGEGTIGRVYKAKYADGKDFVVKKIDSSLIQSIRGVDFPQIATNISKFHHPNIVELIGYCSEQGHNMLVYEYFRNGSLHDFLHVSDDFSKPLTWNTRVRIALGTARAIEYLHELCPLPSVHKNIKSSNILLDTELNPHLSDYGLAIFHERTSQNLGSGYNAPESTKPSAYTMKSDVYSFGVVMLELLTGRRPFDSSKPKLEQTLVRWATPQLHDIDSLEKMVDPALRGLFPPKSVSRFADVIALCVQTEPEFRPPMSEVVQSLIRVVQRAADDY